MRHSVSGSVRPKIKVRYLQRNNVAFIDRGGATVLKVGGSRGTILRAERAKKKFGPPTFWPVGGQNIA